MSFNCLVVDDEKLSRDLIKSYIDKVHLLNFKNECSSGIEAMSLLNTEDFDLMFLDINMPDIKGIQILRQVKNLPPTILCTAYSEYALESYELNVVDYLLKPIEFKRFQMAVDKVINFLSTDDIDISTPNEKSPEYVFVKSDYKSIKIKCKDILFIEAMEKYVRIHTDNQKVMTLMSMSKMMDELNSNRFIRIHRSYIINMDYVEYLEGNRIYIGSTFLPVSKANKKSILQKLKGQ